MQQVAIRLSWYRKLSRAVTALQDQGWYVGEDFWPAAWVDAWHQALQCSARQAEFQPAGLGRQSGRVIDAGYRNDRIRWVDGQGAAETQYLTLMAVFQRQLNRRLLLGLASYECHFALYPPGGFYRRHLDGFREHRARMVSTISYLNADWQAQDGGALVIYDPGQADRVLAQVMPRAGTFVTFLSEVFPHEVLAAGRERCSVTGWFRVRELGRQALMMA